MPTCHRGSGSAWECRALQEQYAHDLPPIHHAHWPAAACDLLGTYIYLSLTMVLANTAFPCTVPSLAAFSFELASHPSAYS